MDKANSEQFKQSSGKGSLFFHPPHHPTYHPITPQKCPSFQLGEGQVVNWVLICPGLFNVKQRNHRNAKNYEDSVVSQFTKMLIEKGCMDSRFLKKTLAVRAENMLETTYL